MSIAVKQNSCTYDGLIEGLVSLAPSRHDKGVVVGNHDNLVNALGLELRSLGDEAGDVVDVAGRCESARNGDEDDLLVLKLF